MDYRILVNGAVLATGSGTGTVAWHPTKYGTYALTYNINPGVATMTIRGKGRFLSPNKREVRCGIDV